MDARFLADTGERTPPAGVLPRLRAIHPRAELVDAGTEWWLGLVEPNPHRRATGARLLRREQGAPEPDRETVRLGRLLLQDFTLVAKYAAADGAMVEDFRRRCWLHDHAPERDDFLAALREATRPAADRRDRARGWWEQYARSVAGDVGGILRGRLVVPRATPTEAP